MTPTIEQLHAKREELLEQLHIIESDIAKYESFKETIASSIAKIEDRIKAVNRCEIMRACADLVDIAEFIKSLVKDLNPSDNEESEVPAQKPEVEDQLLEIELCEMDDRWKSVMEHARSIFPSLARKLSMSKAYEHRQKKHVSVVASSNLTNSEYKSLLIAVKRNFASDYQIKMVIS